ncbi:hypothetical protein ES705_46706 [subsurface metagenome]
MPEELNVATEDRIEVKELLRLSGMSRTQLRNWVQRELLPRPCRCSSPGLGGSSSYYPAGALDRAWIIQRLRSHGVPMRHIRAILNSEKVEL